MRIKVPQVESFRLPDYEPSEAVDQRSSEYSSTLRNALLQGGLSVLDPDIVLDSDPEGYRKMLAETQILSKLEKRVRRSACADWLFTTTDVRHRPVLPIFMAAFQCIQGFTRARKSLLANTILKGWATARIEGEFVERMMPGDSQVRRWWVPTVLTDVAKQRWRVTDNRWGEEGCEPNYEWAIQDVVTHRWYRMDVPGAPPGLRRIDYAWGRYWDTEEDIGYSHGIGRALFHKWYMGSHNWVYALDGAESWSKGKIVIKTPRTFGGQSLPGDVKGQRSGEAIRQKLAVEARKQMARDILVIDSEQDFKVHGQPTSGFEATKWIADSIDDQYREAILGVLAKDKEHVDPDVVNDDKETLDDAVADVVYAFIEWNWFNWLEMGLNPEELRSSVRYFTKRVSSTDPEALGKAMLIAQAMGVPVTKDDVYDGLALTKPQEEDDVALAPPPGSPMSHSVAGIAAPQPATPAGPPPPTPPGPSPLA